MGLNFLGLGFSLGAQDKGLAGAIKDTSSGLMDISKSVVGIGLASTKMIFKAPNFGPAASLAQSLANDVKLTTTGMEAFGVAASKVTSAGLAGLKMTDKEFSKAQGSIASTAFSMNTDVGAVTKSFAALQQAGVDVKKVGFKSFEQYQKFIEVTGTDSTAFAASLGTMSKQMGMSDDAIKDSVTAVAAIGKKFNIGREAVAGMANTVKILNANANLLPQNWSPAKMGQFLKGTTAVAGALTSIGLTADEAMAASQGLTKGLLAGSKGMSDLYAGVKSELPQAFQVMTENFGDANKAFEMLQADPQQFMLKMGDMVKKVNGMHLKPEAMNRFRSQMESTFGPDIMATFNKQGFGQLEPALKDAAVSMKDQGKIVDQLASKYQDGRTYAERFAIAQDQMHTALKKINGVMSDDKYLKNYTQQSKNVVTEMSHLAAKGGVVGKATTMLIEFANRGVGGALAAHTKWGFALSEGIKLMQPMLQYLPAMKMAFSALSSPIGLVVGGMTALYFLFKDLGKGKDSVVGPMLKKFAAEAPAFIHKIGDFIKDIFKTMYDVLSKVDWDSVFKTVTDAIFNIFHAVIDVLASINWGKVFDTVVNVFSKIFNTIFDVLARIDWGQVAKFVADAFKMIFSTIFAVIEKIDWNKVGQVLGQLLSAAMEIAIDLLKAAFKLGEKLLKWLDGIDWGGVGKKFGDYFAQVAAIALDAIYRVLSNLPEILMKIWDHVVSFIIGALDGIRDWLVKKFPSAAGPITTIFDILKGIVHVISGAMHIAFKVIGAVLGFIWDIVKGIFKAIGWVVDKVSGPLIWAFGLIKDAVMWIWDKLKSVGSAIGTVVGAVGGAIGKIGGFFGSIGSGIAGLFSTGKKEGGVFVADMIKKQLELNKKLLEEAKKRNIELAKSGNERAMSEEGYVRTVEGVIMKSTDTLTQYARNASGEVKALYVDASKYVKGFVQGEAYEALEQMQEGIRKEGDALRGKNFKTGSDEQEKWFKDMDVMLEGFDKQHEEYMKKFGVRWDVMYAANEAIKGQFAIQGTLLEKIKTSSVGYYTTMVGLQKSLSAEAGELKLQMLKLEAAGDASSEKYMALQKRYLDSMADGKAKLDQYAQVLSGNLASSLDKYAKTSNEYAQKAAVSAHIIAEGYKNSVTDMLKGVPEQSKAVSDLVTNMMNDLGRAQELKLQEFLKTTKLTGAELDKAVQDITATYKTEQDKITGILKTNHESLMVGATDDTMKMLGEVQKGYAGMIKEVKVKNDEAAGEIQKQFGVTADAALGSVNQIAAIDPNMFRKNMAVVKASFMGFLSEMDAKGKKLLDNTTKSFNDLWKTMNDGWKANTKLLTDFTDSAADHVEKYWGKVMAVALTSVQGFIQLTKQIETGLSALARTMNIMDLLASPDQITAWASQVVSALAYAFMTGGAADAMISASYNKALAMAAELQKNGAATPDTGKMQASGSSSAITAAQGLLMSINHPTWAIEEKELIPTKLETLHQDMIAMLKALQASGETKVAAKTTRPGPKR